MNNYLKVTQLELGLVPEYWPHWSQESCSVIFTLNSSWIFPDDAGAISDQDPQLDLMNLAWAFKMQLFALRKYFDMPQLLIHMHKST